jgi:TolA-binding protein
VARTGRAPAAMGLGLVLAAWAILARGGFAQETAEGRAFQAAARAFEGGTFERAEREFAEFVQNFPTSPQVPEAILYQARAAMRQQKIAAAVELLTTNLAKAGPLTDLYRYRLGEAYLQSTNDLAAAEAFAQVIQEFPKSPRLLEASYGEAMARFRLKEWPRVIQLLQDPAGSFQTAAKVRANDELVARGQLLLGEALLEAGEFKAAEQAVRNLPEADLIPEFQWRRQYLLCRIQMADRRPAEALTNSAHLLTLATLTGQRGLLAESYALRGAILEPGDPAAALAVYTNNLAETTPPDSRRLAFLKTIELTLALDRTIEAAQWLETFFAQYPQDAGSDVALLTLGEIHLKQHLTALPAGATNAATNLLAGATNHLQAALGQFDKLLATFTNSPLRGQAHLNRGWCLWIEGRIAESQGAFQAAVAALPVSEAQAVARLKLADALFYQRDYTNALAHYRAVAHDYAGLPGVREKLGDLALYQALRASLELGDLPGATAAMQQVLREHPRSRLGDRGLLLLGQSYTAAGRPADARKLFARFLQQAPNSPLRPEVELMLARACAEEKQWDQALAQYRAWLDRFGTNALRPEAAFNLAWTSYQAGQASNALHGFTNFLAEFPTHPLSARAQYWLGEYYYGQKDFVNAEKNYQRVFESTNWPVSVLSYQARLMAGRAAFARQVWKDAADHFARLISAGDTNCPPDLLAEAYFALGDTRTMQEPDPNKPVDKFEEAKTAFSRIPQLFPTNALVPRAWGRIGDCCLQQASADSKYYELASEAYQKVLAPELKADVAARSQAEMGLGLVLERQAALKKPAERAATLRQALDRYLNVVYGKNLAEGERLDPVWLREAGLAAARLAEELKQWDVALKLYENLAAALPPLRPSMEKRIERTRELGAGAAEKN